MSDGPAQLGSIYTPNLGGYIPAAQRSPKLWEQALAQFVGNLGGQVAGAAVDRVTAPDMSQAAEQLGVDAPKASGLHRGANASEIEHLSNAGVNKDQLVVARGKAEHDSKLGDAEFLLKVGNSKDAKEAMDKEASYKQQHLDLLKEQFAQAKTEDERAHIRKIYEMVYAQSDKAADNRRADALAKSTVETVNPALAKYYGAGVDSRDATSGLTAEKTKAEQLKNKNRQLMSSGQNPFAPKE